MYSSNTDRPLTPSGDTRQDCRMTVCLRAPGTLLVLTERAILKPAEMNLLVLAERTLLPLAETGFGDSPSWVSGYFDSTEDFALVW